MSGHQLTAEQQRDLDALRARRDARDRARDERTGHAYDRKHWAAVRAANRDDNATYRAGVDEGRKEARAKAKTGTAKKARRKAVRPRPARPAGVDLIQPVTDTATSGMAVFGMCLFVVALYLVLTSAPQLTGFLGFASSGLRWLADPTRVIPTGG